MPPERQYRAVRAREVQAGSTVALYGRGRYSRSHARLSRVLYFAEYVYLEYASGRPERVPPDALLDVVVEPVAVVDDF
jgi:hypothetical protein